MKFTACASTLALGMDGTRFSKEALIEMAKQTKDIPLYFEFDLAHRIGTVKSAEFKENYLNIQGEISNEFKKSKGFVVPAVEVLKSECHGMDDELLIITDLKLHSYGLTSLPADRWISPLSKVPCSIRNQIEKLIGSAWRMIGFTPYSTD